MTHYTPTSNHTDQFSNIITTTQKLQSNTEDKSVNFQAEIWQLFLSELTENLHELKFTVKTIH